MRCVEASALVRIARLKHGRHAASGAGEARGKKDTGILTILKDTHFLALNRKFLMLLDLDIYKIDVTRSFKVLCIIVSLVIICEPVFIR